MFKDSCPDLDAFTDAVTAYISWCEETCYESKLVTVYGNEKTSGNRKEFRKAKYAVRKAISSAKYKYKRKLENQFASNNTRSLWQGLRQITQYKPSASRWRSFLVEISFGWGTTKISIRTFIIFNIYINDLDDNITSNVVNFADDTKCIERLTLVVINNIYKTI